MLTSFIFANIIILVVFGGFEFLIYKKNFRSNNILSTIITGEIMSLLFVMVSWLVLSFNYRVEAYWFSFWSPLAALMVVKFLLVASWAMEQASKKSEKNKGSRETFSTDPA